MHDRLERRTIKTPSKCNGCAGFALAIYTIVNLRGTEALKITKVIYIYPSHPIARGEEGRTLQRTADESLPFIPCREAVKPT